MSCTKKTLKGIRGVRLDNRKVLRAPGPRIKYLSVFIFLRLNYKSYHIKIHFVKSI